jgi:hypothetical protein
MGTRTRPFPGRRFRPISAAFAASAKSATQIRPAGSRTIAPPTSASAPAGVNLTRKTWENVRKPACRAFLVGKVLGFGPAGDVDVPFAAGRGSSGRLVPATSEAGRKYRALGLPVSRRRPGDETARGVHHGLRRSQPQRPGAACSLRIARIPPATVMPRCQRLSPKAGPSIASPAPAATIRPACGSTITGYSGNSICLYSFQIPN